MLALCFALFPALARAESPVLDLDEYLDFYDHIRSFEKKEAGENKEGKEGAETQRKGTKMGRPAAVMRVYGQGACAAAASGGGHTSGMSGMSGAYAASSPGAATAPSSFRAGERVGIAPAQCGQAAMWLARASAIDKALGRAASPEAAAVSVADLLAAIKTLERGLLLEEKPSPRPGPSAARPKIVVAGLTADVALAAAPPISIKQARLNRAVFRHGQRARLFLETTGPARVAVFVLGLDGGVGLLFPTAYNQENAAKDDSLLFPRFTFTLDMVMRNPGRSPDGASPHEPSLAAIRALYVATYPPGRQALMEPLLAPGGKWATFPDFMDDLAPRAAWCAIRVLPHAILAPDAAARRP